MKKLLFIFFIGLAIPQLAISQYYFSAQVSSTDPCCIAIRAGSHAEQQYENLWSVVVDGVTYDTSHGNNILHCVTGNGTYTVDFIVEGYHNNPYWTRDVEVRDCEDECGGCNLDPGTIVESPGSDACTRRFTILGPSADFPCNVSDGNWTANNGTVISQPANGLFAEITFDDPGTHQVCVDVTANDGSGGTCTEQVCTNVVISDECADECEECNLNPGAIDEIFAPNACTRYFRNWGPSATSPCRISHGNWTTSNGTVISQPANGLFAVITFNGPGTHQVCVDVTADDGSGGTCTGQVCTNVIISGECCGLTDDRNCDAALTEAVVPRLTGETFPISASVYPNPANDYVIFEMGALEEVTAQITLTNSTGKTIRNYNEKLNIGTTQIQINDLSTLPTGIYFYQIQVGDYLDYGKLLIQ